MEMASPQRRQLRFSMRRRFRARARWHGGRCACLLVEALEERVVPAVSDLGFENGLGSWNANTGDTGHVSVVSQWVAQGSTAPGTSTPARLYNLAGGAEHFAVLKTAGPYSMTTLSEDFTVGPGVERLSFSAFFDAGDYAPFNDYGDVVLFKDSVPLVTLFAESILGGDGADSNPAVPLLAPQVNGSMNRNAVGGYGNTPWTTIDYAITEPGTYTLEARTSNTGDDALDSYLGLGDVHFVGKTAIDVGAPITAPTGAVVTRAITFNDSTADPFRVEIDPGTGVFAPFNGAIFTPGTPGADSSFDYSNTFAKPGTYNVTFRIHSVTINGVDTSQDDTLVINVFTPEQFASLDDTDTQLVTNPNQPVNAGADGTAQDGSAAHVDASLGSTPGASLFTGSYKSDPNGEATGTGHELIKVGNASAGSVMPTAFFDLRTSRVDANSTLTSTFTVEVDPTVDLNGIKVYYSDDSTWLLVEPDPAFPITKTITGIDPATGKEIVKVQFTATKNSTPSVFDLHGTVFTVAVPAPEAPPTTTPVTGPVASIALPPAALLATSFSSDSGGTFVLRVSGGTDLSASRAEASTSATSTATGGSWYDDAAVQTVKKDLDIQWLLDVLGSPGDANIAPRPAAGGDQRNRPAPPAEPETDGDGPQAEISFETDVVNAMFAEESYEDSEFAADGFGLYVPELAQAVSVDETPVDGGWAVVAAAIGVGSVTFRDERKRQRVRY